MRMVVIITMVFLAYILRDSWSLMKQPYEIIHPFKLMPKIEITRASYVFFLWVYTMLAILVGYISLTKDHWFWHVCFVLQVLELAEYLLTYNCALAAIRIAGHQISLNITNIRFVCFAICLTIVIFIQWNHSD